MAQRKSAAELQEKYRDLLRRLCGYEGKCRYGILRKESCYDQFVEDMLTFCGAWPDIVGDWNETRSADYGMPAGVLGVKKRQKEAVCYEEGMVALHKAVEAYEIGEEKENLFASWVLTKFQFEVKESRRRHVREGRGGIVLNGYDTRLMNRIVELNQAGCQTGDINEIARMLSLETGKKEKTVLEHIYYNQDTYVESFDGSEDRASGGEGGTKGETSASDVYRVCENMEDKEEDDKYRYLWFQWVFGHLNLLLDCTLKGPSKKGDPTKVDQRTVIRYHLTRELLKALKLLDEKEKKSNPDFAGAPLERFMSGNKYYYKWAPPCGQEPVKPVYDEWGRRRLPPAVHHMAAGNRLVYDALADVEEAVMKFLEDDYCEAAVTDRPEASDTLFGLYYNLVRSGFCFDDRYDEKIFSETNKRRFKKWQDRVRPLLLKHRKELLDEDFEIEKLFEEGDSNK